MRRLNRFIGMCVLMLTMDCAYADKQTSIPDSAVDGLGPIHADGTCHFRLRATSGEGYSSRGYTFYPNKTDNLIGWGFGFRCYAGASEEEVEAQLSLTRVNGKIMFNSSPPEAFEPQQHFQLHEISGVNWTGKWVEYDTLYGAPDINFRKLLFCLVQAHGPQVLCGGYDGPPNAVKSRREFNKAAQKILAVIKTIVFVNTPAEAVPTASAPAATH